MSFAPDRTAALAIAALLLLSALAPAAAAPDPGVTLQVEPHFGGHFKYGEWLPLRVTLANDGPAIRAEVRASTSEAGGQATYTVPVELPTGARKRITLYVQPPSFAQAVRVQLMDKERELASQVVNVKIERNINYVVGVIAPRTEAFAGLGGLTLNAQPADGRVMAVMGSFNPRPVKMLPMTLADIPDRPEGLRALDAVVISGVDTSSLAPEQGLALQGWVAQGGRLVLGGGASAARTLGGIPTVLVENVLSPGVTAELSSLEGLNQFAGQEVRVPGPFVVTWPSLNANPAPAQRGPGVLIEQDGHALLVTRHFGEGYVNYAALDLAGSPFDAWAGTVRFWERLLTPGSGYPPNMPPDVSPRLMRANSFSYALQNLPALGLPSIRWLGGLLIVYIALVGPANYVILRRLRKLDWGWVTIPALTLAFSVGAFALGYSMRGGDVIVNKISILAFDRQGLPAPMQTCIGIFSPERRAYTVSLPGRALIAPVSMDNGPWGWSGGAPAPGAWDIVQGDPAQVRGVEVNQWTMQSFQAESPAPEGWSIESDLVIEGERVRGVIVNRTGETVLDAVIVNGNRYARIGDLRPGQPKNVDHALQNSSGSPFPYFIFETMWQNVGPSGPSRELQVRQQLLEGYYGQMKGSQPPAYATLIGWLAASPLDVRVSGVQWTTQQSGMIAAELNLRYPSGTVSVPPGSLPVYLVQTQGNANVCGPTSNQVYVGDGHAVIEFQLPEELTALTVTRMALLIQPDDSRPTVKIYAERSDEWIELDVEQRQRIELPDPARFVSSGGAVRLRLSSDGQMGGMCVTYDLEIEGSLEG